MVFIFSLLLIAGILVSQVFNYLAYEAVLTFITSVCLAFIMIDVGLAFSVEKRSFKAYGWDSLIALTAALLPTLLWFGYFLFFIGRQWKPALLAGLSCAPTSAGVLFAMMSAAGLGATWVFKKARVLAMLDDLATILLLTPLAIIIHGFDWKSILVFVLVGLSLYAAFRWQNSLPCPTRPTWLLLYAFILTGVVTVLGQSLHIHLPVLIPAFMWGCVIHRRSSHLDPDKGLSQYLDAGVKGLFMLLVGLTFPKIDVGALSWGLIAGQVLVLTVLANLGKLFLVFCYQHEVPLRQRIALGVAMFPRGEVGAAVLLIGIGYGLGGHENTLAMLSLALNLILTGPFIWLVILLLKQSPSHSRGGG